MSESLRPSSQPHPSATLLGDGGDYYIPGQAVREPEKVLAAWFFLATETEAPEVRESLRSDVFPLVPRCQPYFQAWRNREGVYDLYADDWVPPEWATVKGDDSSDAAAHRMLPSVLALRDWARRYRLTSPRLMSVAVAVLYDWLREEFDEEVGLEPAPCGRWGQHVDYLAHGWESVPEEQRDLEREVMRKAERNDQLEPFYFAILDRWEPRCETRQEFVKRMEGRLATKLREYLEASEQSLEIRGFKKVPRKAARHHLTWLVQHRVCGLTCEEIADRHAERNPQLESPPTGDAVSKAIRRTAAAIQLA